MAVGYKNLQADAIVGVSGGPVVIYGIHIISDSTAGVVILRNGTTSSDTVIIQETGTVSTGKTIMYANDGVIFPAGCFCDVDAHATNVTVFYKNL